MYPHLHIAAHTLLHIILRTAHKLSPSTVKVSTKMATVCDQVLNMELRANVNVIFSSSFFECDDFNFYRC